MVFIVMNSPCLTIMITLFSLLLVDSKDSQIIGNVLGFTVDIRTCIHNYINWLIFYLRTCIFYRH